MAPRSAETGYAYIEPEAGAGGVLAVRRAKNRACGLPVAKLAKVRDAHLRMALEMELAFGLRREEAIKFSPSYADRGSKIVLKASTIKGGRPREIPVLKDDHRRLLDEARALVGEPVARWPTGCRHGKLKARGRWATRRVRAPEGAGE